LYICKILVKCGHFYKFGTTVVVTFQFLCFIIHVTYNYYFELKLQIVVIVIPAKFTPYNSCTMIPSFLEISLV